jgi:hypothetical protein
MTSTSGRKKGFVRPCGFGIEPYGQSVIAFPNFIAFLNILPRRGDHKSNGIHPRPRFSIICGQRVVNIGQFHRRASARVLSSSICHQFWGLSKEEIEAAAYLPRQLVQIGKSQQICMPNPIIPDKPIQIHPALFFNRVPAHPPPGQRVELPVAVVMEGGWQLGPCGGCSNSDWRMGRG